MFGSWGLLEVVSICDPQVSRDWMDYAPVMALFVPPSIALVGRTQSADLAAHAGLGHALARHGTQCGP